MSDTTYFKTYLERIQASKYFAAKTASPRFENKRTKLFMATFVEDYGISEVTWYRHIVEALELRPEAARVRAPL